MRPVVILLALLAAAHTAALPVEAFFKRSLVGSARLSPDGKYLAFLTGDENAFNLAVLDLATGEAKRLTNFDRHDAFDIHWATAKTLVFEVADGRWALGEVFSVDFDGKHFKQLGATNRVVRLLDSRADADGRILVESIGDDTRTRGTWDVSRLNLRDGALHALEQNRGQTIQWLADQKGQVRIAVDLDDRKTIVRHRATPEAKWEVLVEFVKDDETFEPLRFEPDGRTLLVKASHGNPTLGLYRYDVIERKFIETLAEQPQFDVEEIYWPRSSARVLGAIYEADVPRAAWFDRECAARQQIINQLRPGVVNEFIDQSEDGDRTLIYSYGDRQPGAYFLFEAKTKKLTPLTEGYPWLKDVMFAVMRPIALQSRDGVKLRGYLTTPPGSDGKNLPLVVNPHGGPWARDTWGYDPEVQFLASRGYAVLQINFRGSTGYGHAFLQAGYGQWGLRMQDDVTDAVRWAVAQGIADSQRMAIYGASYGGYAALCGLAFTPELYRCGVSYVGVTDITLLMNTLPESWWLSEDLLKHINGDPRKDRARLEATSPLLNANRIRVPVLMAYGGEDERVNIAHARKLVSKLQDQGTPVDFIMKGDEGHGFRKLKNKVEFYSHLEAFLAKNLAKPDTTVTGH